MNFESMEKLLYRGGIGHHVHFYKFFKDVINIVVDFKILFKFYSDVTYNILVILI